MCFLFAFGDTQNLIEDRFLELLNMEEDEDEAVLQKRLSTWSLDRLKEAGYCLTELSAYWMKANQFGRPVASFTLGPGIMLPEHRFEYVSSSDRVAPHLYVSVGPVLRY